MPERLHRYRIALTWTGNRGQGSSGYTTYSRDSTTTGPDPGGPPPILGSSDPAFRGDPRRWNPEQLLVAALSQCHQLWYLHLAATAGVVVTDYRDDASGTMVEQTDGGGEFTEVTLRPVVTVADAEMCGVAVHLHGEAARMCFIARSVAFPVRHEPRVLVRSATAPATAPGPASAPRSTGPG